MTVHKPDADLPSADRPDAKTATAFELTTFLSGPTKAWGIFEDRFGRVRRRFAIEMHGSWQDGVFRLDERFTYDDGHAERRIWRVTQRSPGYFEATCDDCIGVASGTCTPDMVRMTYAFLLRLPSRVIAVDIDDRLYRISERVAVNRSTVRKWGIRIGELSLFLERQDAMGTAESSDHATRQSAA